MTKITILIILFTLAVNVIFCQPIRLNSDSSNDYHPIWRPGTNSTEIGYTRRFDDYKVIETLSIDNPSVRKRMRIPVPGDYAFSWSPDGSKIAFDARDDTQGNIWIYNLADSSSTQLTNYNSVGAFQPAWSPDGNSICFMYRSKIILMDLISRETDTILDDNEENWHPSWSPDGKKIIFTSERSGNQDIWMINSDGSGLPEQVTNSLSSEDRAKFSPDGRYIAFTSDRNGSVNIWIKTISTGEETEIIAGPSFDSHPDWSPDGKKIAFASLRYGTFDLFYQDISQYLPNNEESLIKPDIQLRNYPNPFNPDTTIELSLPERQFCNITVFDIKGRLIKNIHKGVLTKGRHNFAWNGVDKQGKAVSSGVYFFAVDTENEKTVRKSVLIK